jgi:hypothetical protein
VTYKNLSLNVVVDWQKGSDVINLTRYLMDDARTAEDWGTPAGIARYRGYTSGSIEPYIEDGSFVKVREVSVGLDVPRRYISSISNVGVDRMRVSLTGRNLFMWTDYSGVDPEVANFGAAAIRNNLDIGPYPPTRSFFLNITLGF